MWPFRKNLAVLAESASDEELLSAIREQSPARLDKFSELERAVHTVWWLKAETHNGTLEQYFTNSTGNDCPMLLGLLDRIGADDTATVLRGFIEKLATGDTLPDRAERNQRIEELREQDEASWEKYVRGETNKIEATFPGMVRATARFARGILIEKKG